MTDAPYPVNSRDWWEWYFSGQWDLYDGRAQTRYFMRSVIDNLPAPERDWLSSHACSILDWGCAYGDGVDLLSSSFPRATVTGLDFSERAIEEARRRYLQCRFVHSEAGSIPGSVDCIVTSNCLEHFADPLSIAAAHLKSCRYLYLILTPFEEYPRHESHAVTLTHSSFPNELGGFRRIHSTAFQTDPKVWQGSQLLTIYASRRYRLSRRFAGLTKAIGLSR